MAFRSDITVNWTTSPRIITVLAPSTELTIQDLYDTLKELEQQPHNMVYPALIDAAGKEDLGGGVLVGLTAELQNAVVAFEARPNRITDGTITTADPSGTTLVDSAATLQSDGVISSYSVINRTDQSVATLITIDSETQTTHYALQNGSDNQWEVGDEYIIYPEILCNISGGNLVSVDENQTSIDPIFPTFGTNTVRTSSSSATLQEQRELQFSSFNGCVTIDTIDGTTGVLFPAGTPLQPVNNLADAITIAEERGFDRICFISDYTFESGDNVSLYELEGRGLNSTTLTFNPGSICTGSKFYDCTVTGFLLSPLYFDHCRLRSVDAIDTGLGDQIFVIHESEIKGTIVLDPNFSGEIHFVSCYSGEPGNVDKAIIDYNGCELNTLFRNWHGGLIFRNITNPTDISVSIDMTSGNFIIEDNCTTGNITLRGTGEWLNKDSFAGTSNVTDRFVSLPNIQLQLQSMEVDGVTFQQFAQAAQAVLTGKLVISENAPGDVTLEFKSQDGTVTFVTGRVQNGVRIEGNVNEENM